MGKSVLVFVSHASEDKKSYIDPIVSDLEDCFINVWIDRRKIVPGDNLRTSIFRDGLDKADVVLLFFTQQSLKSSWVDREIKHVLREEAKKGNNLIFTRSSQYSIRKKRMKKLANAILNSQTSFYI
jgi:hypothetical protein